MSGAFVGFQVTFSRLCISQNSKDKFEIPRLSQLHSFSSLVGVSSFKWLPVTSNTFEALVRVAEPISLTSIFPYAWKLVLHYEIGDPRDAAFWAGILIAAFSLAEALTGMFWGSLSDRVGRKKVVILGSCGTALSLLIVGFAPSFWIALLGRVVGGLLNGNVGVIQVSDLHPRLIELVLISVQDNGRRARHESQA